VDDFLAGLLLLFSWRFWVPALMGSVAALFAGQAIGGLAAFALFVIGLGWGLLWQGRWMTRSLNLGEPPAQPIARPIAFLGYALVGGLWGGFAAEYSGSVVAAAMGLVAAVLLVGGWNLAVRKRAVQPAYLLFAALALLSGLGALWLIGLARH